MEGFVTIPMFDNYLIDRTGKVFSKITNRFIMGSKDKRGYVTFCLYRNNKPKTMGRYRLMAMSFLGVPDDLRMQVNHINGIKSDDRIENLEWVTQSENTLHAIRMGLYTPHIRKGNSSDLANGAVENNRIYFKKDKVIQQLKDGILINEYRSTLQAMRETGFHYVLIGKCANDKVKSAYGFQWKYKTPA